MRFLLSLAASALATNYSKEPRNVTLKFESNDTRFNDKGLASVDFGDRIRGVLISNDLWVYEEISRNDGIYDFINGQPLILCQYFDQIVFRFGIYQNNMTYVRGTTSRTASWTTRFMPASRCHMTRSTTRRAVTTACRLFWSPLPTTAPRLRSGYCDEWIGPAALTSYMSNPYTFRNK